MLTLGRARADTFRRSHWCTTVSRISPVTFRAYRNKPNARVMKLYCYRSRTEKLSVVTRNLPGWPGRPAGPIGPEEANRDIDSTDYIYVCRNNVSHWNRLALMRSKTRKAKVVSASGPDSPGGPADPGGPAGPGGPGMPTEESPATR